MRVAGIVAVVSVLSAPALWAQAPEWIVYVDRAERFTINLPGQPTVRETDVPAPARPHAEGTRLYRAGRSTALHRDGRQLRRRQRQRCAARGGVGSVELPEAGRRDHLRQLRECGPHQRPPAAYYTRRQDGQHRRDLSTCAPPVHPGGAGSSEHPRRAALPAVAADSRRTGKAHPVQRRRQRRQEHARADVRRV